jgi:hypothetical protein
VNILWCLLLPCFVAETHLIQCRNNSDAAQKKQQHSQISTDGARQSMLQTIKKGLCRPVGVIGFCWSGRVYAKMVNGQEGPYPAAPGVHLGPYSVPGLFDASQSRILSLPSESAAPISEIFGVTHSNFSFFPTASSLLLSSRSVEVIIE